MTVLATENSVVGRLELTRQALGLSIKDFVQLCGISFQAYYSYLNGTYVPSIKVISKLIEATRKHRETRNKVTYEWLYDGNSRQMDKQWRRRISDTKRSVKILSEKMPVDIIQAKDPSSAGKKISKGKEDALSVEA